MRKYFILCLFLYSFSATAENVMQNKNVELNKVSGEIKQLQQTISLNRQEQNHLEQSLKHTEITISNLSLQINHLNQSITQEQRQLNELKSSHHSIQLKMNQQHAILAKQICTAYQLKPLQPIKIILNQENPSTIQRHLTYYNHLTTARLRVITNIKYSLSMLKINMHEIIQHQDNLKKLLTQKQDQQHQQQLAQTERQQLLNRLHQSSQTKQQQLDTLMTNQKALQSVIKGFHTRIEKEVTGQSFIQLRGKLRWPVQGTLVANYGSALDVAGIKLSGVVIQAAQNTPIRAIYNGKVVFANWLRGFGLLVIINHNNSYMSLYSRNQVLYIKAGDQVRTGDIIATTGNSGGFDKAGLYFEIRQNGIPVNPNIWCS